MTNILEILFAVTADVLAYYICKWLDNKTKHDS